MRRRALLCCAALCCAAVGAAVDGAAVDGAFVADGAYAAEGASVDGASVERASVVYAMETYCQCRTNETESGLMIDGLRHRRKNGLGLSVDVFGESGCRVSNTFLQRLKRPDPPQLTVLVLAYLPALNHRVERCGPLSRNPPLASRLWGTARQRLACAYATVRAVRKVLVLWNGPAGRQPNASCAYGATASFSVTETLNEGLERGPRGKASNEDLE
ncbi:hypothetical protein M885DRAFT_499810 [Pelagophyceae sp. CCMP2097]|nr:hypothetical protein M885DRAFT_499810 [Pelagophyceae sp. CCMP2097]